ncbi:MAG TPA: Rrf2 family transcriptional regulator [Candidatus Omnitrophota bacterium]|nr:Rrf2 family transcriptional regulator [Candidatus Omnitrophota bacterium]
MKLTTRSEYAFLAMLSIARSKEKGYIPLSKIAKEQKLPIKYMEQLMQTLCRAGYLSSTRGKEGGYRLAKPSQEITIAEIIRLFDGALAPTESVSTYFYRSTPLLKEKKLIKMMKKIRDYIAHTLETHTLADVI